jgi:hypothetical protein
MDGGISQVAPSSPVYQIPAAGLEKGHFDIDFQTTTSRTLSST